MSIFKQTQEIQIIKGMKVPVEITIEVEVDDLDPTGDFDFGSKKENEEYLTRFKRGDLFIGVILVRIKAIELDIEGFSSLGGCHLRSNNLFQPEPFKEDVENTVEEYALVTEAARDLEANVLRHLAVINKMIKELT